MKKTVTYTPESTVVRFFCVVLLNYECRQKMRQLSEASDQFDLAVISSLFQMTRVTRDHCVEIITKFEPCSDNQKRGLLGIDGMSV